MVPTRIAVGVTPSTFGPVEAPAGTVVPPVAASRRVAPPAARVAPPGAAPPGGAGPHPGWVPAPTGRLGGAPPAPPVAAVPFVVSLPAESDERLHADRTATNPMARLTAMTRR